MSKLRLRYIDHSGFLLETSEATFLFDYFRGEKPEINPEKPLYIFASHVHEDHYNPEVFGLAADIPEVYPILSDDINPALVPEAYRDMAEYLAPHAIFSDGLLHVETLRSNDCGVAFLISTQHGDEELQLYFAGDLNDWNWDGDAEDALVTQAYRAELELIKDVCFDLAFVSLDPRLGPNAFGGIEEFMAYADAKQLVPIHMWGQYGIIDALKADPCSERYRDRLLTITHEGEEFEL